MKSEGEGDFEGYLYMLMVSTKITFLWKQSLWSFNHKTRTHRRHTYIHIPS